MTWLEKLKNETTEYLKIYKEFKNSISKAEKYVEEAFAEKVRDNKEKAAEIENQEHALYPVRDKLKEKFDKLSLILQGFLNLEAKEKELTGKKIHYERVIKENKLKFWISNKTEKEDLTATENSLKEIKIKKAELHNKLYGGEATYDTVKKELEDVEGKIEEFRQQKQKVLENVDFKSFFNSNEGRLVYKTYDKLRTLAINLADEDDIDSDIWFDLYLSWMVNPTISFDELFTLVAGCTDKLTDNYCIEDSIAFDGASILCEEQYNKLCNQLNYSGFDEVQDSIFFEEYILPPFYRATISTNALLISKYCESMGDDAPVQEGFKLDSYGFTVEPVVQYYQGMNDYQTLTILSEKFLTAVLTEIENNPDMNVAELGLALRKKFNKKNECETQITPMLQELDRLFKLTPEQTLIEEQRYYKQKELEQMELDRQQRERDAEAERQMYEWQAEQDREAEERRWEREERNREARHREQMNAEQRRWEEDKRREDEQRRKDEEAERKRQREQQRESYNKTMAEAKAKREMMRLCWRCANYEHGCHGGIVGCGNYRAK